jgi:hypothetical protein
MAGQGFPDAVRFIGASARPYDPPDDVSPQAGHPRFPDMERARGDMRVAYIAVATLRGRKPIAFLSVHDASGKARIFGDPSRCARS